LKNKQILIYLLSGLFFAGIVTLALFTDFLINYWWFDTLEQTSTFLTRYLWKGALWGLVFLATYSLLYLNAKMTVSLAYQNPKGNLEKSFLRTLKFGALFVSFLTANVVAPQWEDIALYLNYTNTNIVDPIFSYDVSFYLFELPILQGLKQYLITMIIFMLLTSIFIYSANGLIQLFKEWKRIFTGPINTHLSALLVFGSLCLAWHFWLNKYNLLLSSEGLFFGAGYTDLSMRLLSYYFMAGVSLLGGLLLAYSIFKPGLSLIIPYVILLFFGWLFSSGILPSLQQRFVVEPNELEKEKEYLVHNIRFTRLSYQLEKVNRSKYEWSDDSSFSLDKSDSSWLKNIRLWDWRPLLSTYKQIQEIRLYYNFNDVDIDRYQINGEQRQVMLAVRELASEQIPTQARTWVNEHLKYTHGYGAVMSPVNQITKEGLPELFIKNIPPESAIGFNVTRPEIYYGEQTSNYIFTGTTTDEFDYPIGSSNSFNRYDGRGGIPLNSFFRRAIAAYHLRTIKLLFSEYITNETKLHINRDLVSRVQKLAPFLSYDRDPYPVILNGRIYWIIDTYTTSKSFPYSAQIKDSNINYIRNPVKTVIDAYNGDVSFFITDEKEPIIQSYKNVYPNLFKSMKDAPPGLSKHFRHPVDFFSIQSQIFASYHMTDPAVFYNQEDLWKFPSELYADQLISMEPYYVNLNLPGEENSEYLLILPFTPMNKDNMVGWLAARCDGDRIGELVLYEFPKSELIYGPKQIEARIDQDPEISPELTLWSQQGSKVIRGNLLVIPIKGQLLYIEPLYLRAENGQMPELKRVIIAFQNQIVMGDNLSSTLAKLNLRVSSVSIDKNGLSTQSMLLPELIEQVIKQFKSSKESISNGNWLEYGQTMAELEQTLAELEKKAK
jgi:uncharacterized protein